MAVQIDRTRVVLPAPGVEPVPADHVPVRVEVAEEAIGDDHFPGVVLHLLPALDDLGPLEDDLLAGGRPVHDTPVIGSAATRRADSLAIDPLVDGNDVARLRLLGGVLHGAPRGGRRPGIGVMALDADMELGGGRGGRENRDAENLGEDDLHVLLLELWLDRSLSMGDDNAGTL